METDIFSAPDVSRFERSDENRFYEHAMLDAAFIAVFYSLARRLYDFIDLVCDAYGRTYLNQNQTR